MVANRKEQKEIAAMPEDAKAVEEQIEALYAEKEEIQNSLTYRAELPRRRGLLQKLEKEVSALRALRDDVESGRKVICIKNGGFELFDVIPGEGGK